MRIGGLASGMDIDQIVKDLMTAERMPLDKLTQSKMWMEWQQESYRESNLSLSNLRTSAGSLRFTSAFNAYSATSSNTSSLTVSTNSNAVSGSYSVTVDSVASSAKMNSAETITIAGDPSVSAKSTDVIGVGGTITVSGGTSITITSDMTYAAVAKEIQNSTAGTSTELRASFDNTTSRFFISTKGMGTDQNFTLDFGTNTGLANQIIKDSTKTGTPISFSTTNGSPGMTAATDGALTIDGIEVVGLKTNQTTINGLTINLLQASTTPATITVQSDTAKPLESIKKFVEQYNETIAKMEIKLIEKKYPDFKPLSDEQKAAMSDKEVELWEEKSRSGLLRNDPILKSALQDLRREFMKPVSGLAAGNINMLSEIGISTGNWREGGKLFIDEDKLKKVLADKPDEVMELFTKTNVGVGQRVYKELDNIVKTLSNRAGSPGSSTDNSTLSKRLDGMNDEINKWQDRLIKVEDRYWRQFTAMEKALSQMNNQSTWMQQNMFGGM